MDTIPKNSLTENDSFPPEKRSCLSLDYDTSDAIASITGVPSRKVAIGCHVFKALLKKDMSRKKCFCGSYCHNKCLGLCNKPV